MKIRKILPLLLIVIASVFLLSSCQAILDAIFSNNTISVYVSENWNNSGYTSSDYVALSIPEASVSTTVPYTGSNGTYTYWSLSVPKLSDGNYTVTVNYYHWNGGTFVSLPPVSPDPQLVTFPQSSGSPHNANLSFNF